MFGWWHSYVHIVKSNVLRLNKVFFSFFLLKASKYRSEYSEASRDMVKILKKESRSSYRQMRMGFQFVITCIFIYRYNINNIHSKIWFFFHCFLNSHLNRTNETKSTQIEKDSTFPYFINHRRHSILGPAWILPDADYFRISHYERPNDFPYDRCRNKSLM